MLIENQAVTLQAFGSAAVSQIVNTPVATLVLPAASKYKVWGSIRHTLADGCKMVTPTAIQFCSGPNDTAAFGPIIVDVNTAPTNVAIQLAVATGASDTASATIYAQRMT
jgi:hypothetical protein